LKNIRTSNQTFIDVQILIEEPMEEKHYEKLWAWHKISKDNQKIIPAVQK
jgi:hypothetical protein